jgi:hypothetical protein
MIVRPEPGPKPGPRHGRGQAPIKGDLVDIISGKFTSDKTVQVHVEVHVQVQAAHSVFRCNQRVSQQKLIGRILEQSPFFAIHAPEYSRKDRIYISELRFRVHDRADFFRGKINLQLAFVPEPRRFFWCRLGRGVLWRGRRRGRTLLRPLRFSFWSPIDPQSQSRGYFARFCRLTHAIPRQALRSDFL